MTQSTEVYYADALATNFSDVYKSSITQTPVNTTPNVTAPVNPTNLAPLIISGGGLLVLLFFLKGRSRDN